MENIVKLAPVCGGGPGNDCQTREACVVTFEEPTLSDLSESVMKWITERPSYLPISVSHGFQTEWERGSGVRKSPAGALAFRPHPGLPRGGAARARECPINQGLGLTMAGDHRTLKIVRWSRQHWLRARRCERLQGPPVHVFFEAQNLGLLGKAVTGVDDEIPALPAPSP